MIESSRGRIFAQGSLREYANDGDNFDRNYLPGRSLALRPTNPEAKFLLPDNPSVRQYASQLGQIHEDLGLAAKNSNNTVFVPDTDYLLDVAIRSNLAIVAKHLDRQGRYTVYPYAVTEDTRAWIEDLRGQGYDIQAGLPQRTYYENMHDIAHRGGWGRHVGDPDKPSFPERTGIPYPQSYIGQGEAELLEAYTRVTAETGTPHVFVKPIFSAGGFTLSEATNPQEVLQAYHALRESGALNVLDREAPIEIQARIDGIKGLYSLQYGTGADGKLRIVSPKGITEQLVEGTRWAGNIFNNGITRDLAGQAQEIFNRFREGAPELYGWGGIDFASVATPQGDRLVVIEHNGQRITGGHPAIALAHGLGVESPFMTTKPPGEVNCDVLTLWDVLRSLNLQFDPIAKKGMFPIVWMEGSGMIMAANEDTHAMQGEFNRVYNELARNGYIVPKNK